MAIIDENDSKLHVIPVLARKISSQSDKNLGLHENKDLIRGTAKGVHSLYRID